MVESGPSQDPGLQEDARLSSLEKRLREAQQEEAERTGKHRPESQVGRSQGMRILSDLFGMPLGGGLVGFALDGWLGTRPWLMLALMFLGFIVAIRNVMWISRQPPK